MYLIERSQDLPIPLEEAWAFFSSPNNLSKITPKNLGFVVMGSLPEHMYEGLFIHYKVSPLAGIPMKWTTEITHIRPMEYFVDEQRVGPYSIWHHEHFFEAIPGGVRMTDRVHYQVPFGILGRLVHPFLVRPRLEEIFSFRFKAAEELFAS
ncbi:MAG: SRPBCC family protein [Schleiferiaceae bacterium]|nr:SRPBCC family protein [Schleiferiaceae bacterium]